MEDVSLTTKLEQYACDYCRSKKLKCSREKPKCDHCRPWPGKCVYSRQGRLPRQVRPKLDEDAEFNTAKDRPPQSPLESRLSNIEASIESLSYAIQQLTSIVTTTHRLSNDQPEVNTFEDEPGEIIEDLEGTPCYVGSPHTSSFLSLASETLESLERSDEIKLPGSAATGLSDLSKAFAAAGFDDNARKELERARREQESFYIHDQVEGARLMQIFIETIDIGAPFFQRPPSALLLKIAFEPSKVPDRGWVLLFNCLLSTRISLQEPQNLLLNHNLRRNVWLALDSSSLFLEPSLIKIQAFMLLATHGQEFSTPGLCWTLLSHACRMSQALGLQTALRRSSGERGAISSEQELKQFTFWGLYVTDKTLSLAFGRPPFLTGPMYDALPFPHPRQLNKFRPHTRGPGLSGSENTCSGFGSVYLLQTMKLSKVEGRILHHLHHGDRRSTSSLSNPQWFEAQKFEARAWLEETAELLSRPATQDNASPYERSEMELGLKFVDFRYHSLVVFLTRRRIADREICLQSARSALALLGSLVSNSSQVYNGIVWQLLYFPFTHFFILFGNILSESRSVERTIDLSLLRSTVSYFGRMRHNHPTASKLQKIAQTFTGLAEKYVNKTEGEEKQSQKTQSQEKSEGSRHNQVEGDTSCLAETLGASSFALPNPPTYQQPGNLLVKLNTQALDDFDPSNFDFNSAFPSCQAGIIGEAAHQILGESVADPQCADEMMRMLGETARKRSFDYAFDWFSWHGGEQSLVGGDVTWSQLLADGSQSL